MYEFMQLNFIAGSGLNEPEVVYNRPEVAENEAFSNLRTKASLTKIIGVNLQMTQVDPKVKSEVISRSSLKLHFKRIWNKTWNKDTYAMTFSKFVKRLKMIKLV